MAKSERDKQNRITPSSGNVFKDFHLPDADELQAKVRVAVLKGSETVSPVRGRVKANTPAKSETADKSVEYSPSKRLNANEKEK